MITTKNYSRESGRALEENLLFTVENMTDGFLTVNQEWEIVYINKEAARIWQKPKNELMGNRLWDVMPKTIIPMVRSHYLRSMEKRLPEEFEVSRPGRNVWYEVRVYPSPEGISVHFRDIADRKKGQRLLEESEERYRTQSNKQMMALSSQRGSYSVCQQKYLDIFGYAK